MKKLYDLSVPKNSYTNKAGDTKAVWLNIGSIMENTDGKRFIFLDRTFNPAGVPNPENRSNVLVSMFKSKEVEQQPENTQEQMPETYPALGF
jgi:hypothetical protein